MLQHSFNFTSFDPSVLLVCDSTGEYRPAQSVEVLAAAEQLLKRQIHQREIFSSPSEVQQFLKVRLASLEYEVFAVMLLDVQNRLIDYLEMFRGTVAQTSVYPREVAKECLARNAASVVLVHNHPSGSTQPSRADESLTQTLKSALALVDVRVLDHMIVGGNDVFSFAQKGLL